MLIRVNDHTDPDPREKNLNKKMFSTKLKFPKKTNFKLPPPRPQLDGPLSQVAASAPPGGYPYAS